jgi:hypothetical protein
MFVGRFTYWYIKNLGIYTTARLSHLGSSEKPQSEHDARRCPQAMTGLKLAVESGMDALRRYDLTGV